MKSNMIRVGIVLATITSFSHTLAQPGGGKDTRPIPPEVAARQAEVTGLVQRGREHIRTNRFGEAIAVLDIAAYKEDEVFGPGGHASSAKYELARLYTRLGRTEEALNSYRRALKWDPQTGNIRANGPSSIQVLMDYAMLLANSNKATEAKEIFYAGLRTLNEFKSRDKEPVPFLVVFNEESDGVSWEYSRNRLAAAALMLKAMDGGSADHTEAQLTQNVQTLAPDWFYPVMRKAAARWNESDGSQLLARAKSLARPGVERALIERYEVELAEHRAYLDANDLMPTPDSRPMSEGARRRSLMQCLRPNLEVLRRISIGWPPD